MEEEKNVNIESEPVEKTDVVLNPQEEAQALLGRLAELLNTKPVEATEAAPDVSDQPENQARQFPTLNEIQEVVNKAVEFRPMAPQKELTPVEKFLYRENGPLSRYTNLKEDK